ncbi:MAG: hypothetical protein BWY31_00410 [Lentisphaerae bacterium ADurb.Bin242]|nr:MAG: hypothetical protein BWY31_00410 [Lentisphaerae bacterium ADurb.Bin242]
MEKEAKMIRNHAESGYEPLVSAANRVWAKNFEGNLMKKLEMCRRKKRPFTLTELLIVIAIITISSSSIS